MSYFVFVISGIEFRALSTPSNPLLNYTPNPFYFIFFKIGSCSVVQIGLKLRILLPRSPKYLELQSVPVHLVRVIFSVGLKQVTSMSRKRDVSNSDLELPERAKGEWQYKYHQGRSKKHFTAGVSLGPGRLARLPR